MVCPVCYLDSCTTLGIILLQAGIFFFPLLLLINNLALGPWFNTNFDPRL
jgi:hypothetical protein